MASSGEFDGGRRFLAETGGIIAEAGGKGKLRSCENRDDPEAAMAICGTDGLRRAEGQARDLTACPPRHRRHKRPAPRHQNDFMCVSN